MRTYMREDLVRIATVSARIHLSRDLRVMLDSDVAVLYRITTSNVNKAVGRNRDRVPGLAVSVDGTRAQKAYGQVSAAAWSAGFCYSTREISTESPQITPANMLITYCK
jgi:ORF6N domain